MQKKAISPNLEMVLVESFAIFQISFEIQRKSHLSEGAPQSHHSLTPFLHLQIEALNKLGIPPSWIFLYNSSPEIP